MEHINTFSKGLVQDRSFLDNDPATYFDAKNIRILTDKGNSNGALINAKGNKHFITIPDAPRVWKLTRSSTILPSPWTSTILLVTSTGILTSTISGTLTETHEYIEILYTELTTNPIYTSTNLVISRPSDDSIILYMDPSSTTTQNIDNIIVDTYQVKTLIGEYTPKPIIIGQTSIRESIVVFTTRDTSEEGSYGQIWEITTDSNDVPSVKFVMNNLCNFSTKHPITAKGRYENSNIKRVYWTDFFNHLRSLNITDVNSAAIEVSELDIQPQANLNMPRVHRVEDGGNLRAGTLQYSYRLKGKGRVTNFSPVSKVVHIVEAGERNASLFKTNAVQYIGSDPDPISDPTGKLVKLRLTGLDTRYDTLELVYLHRVDEFSDPEIEVFEERTIPTTGNLTIVHSGNENTFTVSVDDFTTLGLPFTKVKTLEINDNMLIVGNVVENSFVDIKFNSRAYRYNSGFNTYVSNDAVTNVTPPWDPTITREDLDAINPFNTNDLMANPYKFKADGVTLGGEGPFVSYEFTKELIEGNSVDSRKTIAGTQPAKAPFSSKNRRGISINIDGIPYFQEETFLDYKAPIVNGTLKGYQRGEIYRFGIVLFDKKHRPSFVNWIGDIRFPDFHDEDTVGTPTLFGSYPDFQMCKKDGVGDGSQQQYFYTLGINFTINFPAEILEQISGFSIVRTEREDSDKTRLGTGLVQGLVEITGHPYGEPTDTGYFIPHKMLNSLVVPGIPPIKYLDPNLIIMYTPEFMFNEYSGAGTNDKLRIFAISEYLPGYKDNTGMQPNTEYYKYFDSIAVESPGFFDYNINEAAAVERGQTRTVDSYQFWNYSFGGPITFEESKSMGNDVIAMSLNTPFDWEGMVPTGVNYTGVGDLPPLDFYITNNMKYYGALIRNIADQYGGASEYDRARNTYISCSNFIVKDPTASSYNFKVFGGDTYITFFGNTNLEKNIGDDLVLAVPSINPDITEVPDHRTQMTGAFWPAETSFNNELRTGYHMANKADESGNYPDILDSAARGQLAFDEYTQYKVYSQMNNNVLSYIPKPILNNNVSLEQDNRIYASETKVNGEETDSWTIFKESTNISVDGQHGPITTLINFKDNLFFVQENAVGVISINPTALVQTNELSEESVKLGSGGILDNYTLIILESGSRHQWSVVASPFGLYWFDANKRKCFRYAGDGPKSFSDIQGLFGFFNTNFSNYMLLNDNPIEGKGVVTVYDNIHNELLFTFLDEPKSGNNSATIAYNEVINAYTSFYDFTPRIYLKNNRRLLSPNPSVDYSEILEHNTGSLGEYLGKTLDSYVKMRLSPNPANTKIFDNMVWLSTCLIEDTLENESDTIDQVRFSNTLQNTDWVVLSNNTNLQRRERDFNIHIPRNAVIPNSSGIIDIYDPINLDTSRLFRERMRDKYLNAEFKISNLLNRRYIINYMKFLYRIQAR